VTFKEKRRQQTTQKWIPVLIIGALGTVGVVALYALVPGFQTIDLVLLLIVVAFGAMGYNQGILRVVTTAVMLYVATGVAATFYPQAAPFTKAIQTTVTLDWGADVGGSVGRGTLALSFSLLTAIIWVTLEAITRLSFRDTSLPKLGILDKLGGLVGYLIIGIVVVSLAFNLIGYGRSRPVHDKAFLRTGLNQVLYLHYITQSFWFPKGPPPIYVYDLRLSR